MKIEASFNKYVLTFKRPAGTSRGVLKTKDTYFLKLLQDDKVGIGECSLFRGLSYDDNEFYEDKLAWVCENINLGEDKLLEECLHFPSIQFGIEMAFADLRADKRMELFPSKFTESQDDIDINGLIWMGSKEFMLEQVQEKLHNGFSCIKMKIGAIDFDQEISILKNIREKFSKNDIELRVDANGAFTEDALEKLKVLSQFDLHSIEQPIKQGNIAKMKSLCELTPLDIALDEELIGIVSYEEKAKLLDEIKPQYIILKPSLIGGIKGTDEWIKLAEERSIEWWITSALESNIGLNAIAQYTYTLNSKLPQGLGTGSLFTNNIDSPLVVKNGKLLYDNNKTWDLSIF